MKAVVLYLSCDICAGRQPFRGQYFCDICHNRLNPWSVAIQLFSKKLQEEDDEKTS